eukprot:2248782-Pyramimonas_sp.AAC.1
MRTGLHDRATGGAQYIDRATYEEHAADRVKGWSDHRQHYRRATKADARYADVEGNSQGKNPRRIRGALPMQRRSWIPCTGHLRDAPM